ncbi:MAG: malic enzyme-like NAD(P)-binding protein [Vampirovibrionales bacterium]
MTSATPVSSSLSCDRRDEALTVRREHRGLIGIRPKLPVRDTKTLSLVYTPGVARPCLEIAADALKSYDMTIRGNTVAVISDGSSVYGLGNVGAAASIPLLEVRSAFHKTFAGIDAMPIALDTQSLDEIVETIRTLTPTFGGIQLDAISSPRCFAIDERLKRALNVPVLHTDQEAVAVGVLAALQNALKVVGKTMANAKIVISGCGAAGVATAKFLLRHHVGDIKVCDRYGVIGYRRLHGMHWVKSEIGRLTNPTNVSGTLADVLRGADVFIGLSATDFITPEMIATMASKPIVFALSLSPGEITYHEAQAAGAAVVATSQSNAPNQLNSSVIYPGIFRGALDVRATSISHAMYDAAASAYAAVVESAALSPEWIIPDPLDLKPAAVIAQAVAQAAMVDGVARETNILPHTIYERVMAYHAGGSAVWVRPPKTGIESQPVDEQALDLHTRFQGTMEVVTHVPIDSKERYDLIYSAPHSSEPCRAIMDDPSLVYDLTLKNNLVGIVVMAALYWAWVTLALRPACRC